MKSLANLCKEGKELFKRGFTDTLYVLNFISVHIINLSIIILTAVSGILNITDMSALAVIPAFSYAELGIHTGFIIWKAKAENMSKFGIKEDCEYDS